MTNISNQILTYYMSHISTQILINQGMTYYSTLDKQRICVNTQLKSSKKKAIKMKCVRTKKAILTIGMQLHAMSLHTIWSISFPFE